MQTLTYTSLVSSLDETIQALSSTSEDAPSSDSQISEEQEEKDEKLFAEALRLFDLYSLSKEIQVNRLRHVHQLPNELLEYIFEISLRATNSPSRARGLLSYAGVCQRWSGIVAQAAHLWAFIDSDGEVNLNRKMISFSRNVPLTATFHQGIHPSFVMILLSYLSKCKVVSLGEIELNEAKLFFKSLMEGNKSESLQSLCLLSNRSGGRIEIKESLTIDASTLFRLEIPIVHIPPDLLIINSPFLKILRLEIPSPEQTALSEYYRILNSVQQLEELVLEGVKARWHRDAGNIAEGDGLSNIVLPRLRRLTLQRMPARIIMAFLQAVESTEWELAKVLGPSTGDLGALTSLRMESFGIQTAIRQLTFEPKKLYIIEEASRMGPAQRLSIMVQRDSERMEDGIQFILDIGPLKVGPLELGESLLEGINLSNIEVLVIQRLASNFSLNQRLPTLQQLQSLELRQYDEANDVILLLGQQLPNGHWPCPALQRLHLKKGTQFKPQVLLATLEARNNRLVAPEDRPGKLKALWIECDHDVFTASAKLAIQRAVGAKCIVRIEEHD